MHYKSQQVMKNTSYKNKIQQQVFVSLMHDTRIINAGYAKHNGPISPEKTWKSNRASSKDFLSLIV
jgi:hypothetical protein